MCNMFNMCYNSIFRDDIPCDMCVTCVVTWLLTILWGSFFAEFGTVFDAYI